MSVLLPVALSGQEIRILSEQDRLPVEHVAVYTMGLDHSTISDAAGRVELGRFDPSDTLCFQHPSFESRCLPVEVLLENNVLLLAPRKVQIDEFVISASKSRESLQSIAHMVDVLEPGELMESSALSSAEILEGSGKVLVQKSQGGGGSPILRGFEANKVLLVVDGVRMNNAIYRSGHLQNSITIDHAILDRTEVIFGPSSVIYGSDALGGVIHYYTRVPELRGDSGRRLLVQAGLKYASAQRASTSHLNIEGRGKYWASLSSFSFKDLGDLRMGSRRRDFEGSWGQVPHYVGQVNGSDSMLVNPNPLLQLNTAYRQMDLLQKFRYTPSLYVDWIINLQYSTSSEVDRLDKLNDYSGDELKYAEYHYGPQQRFLASLKNVIKKDNLLFTNMTTQVAWQRIDEDRISRKYQNDQRLVQEEDVQVWSLTTDLLKLLAGKHRLYYGAELNFNQVLSDAWYRDISTSEQSPAQTRYPAGGSHTLNAALYASYKHRLGQSLILNLGSRYSYGGMYSSFLDPNLPYQEIEIRNGALTGSASLVWTPTDSWQLNAILSTGFRNPNVDDYGKVRAKDDYVTVPNPELRSEYSYNAELGLRRNFGSWMELRAVVYYTYLDHAITRSEYQVNGSDSLLYDGDWYRVTSNVNAARAQIYGASGELHIKPARDLSLQSTLNYTRGRNLSEDVPLGHIPPCTAVAASPTGSPAILPRHMCYTRAGSMQGTSRPTGRTMMVKPWRKAIPPGGPLTFAEATASRLGSTWCLVLRTSLTAFTRPMPPGSVPRGAALS